MQWREEGRDNGREEEREEGMEQSAVKEGRGGEVGCCSPILSGVAAI